MTPTLTESPQTASEASPQDTQNLASNGEIPTQTNEEKIPMPTSDDGPATADTTANKPSSSRRESKADTVSSAGQDRPYRLLSELLKDIPPEELCRVLEHYEDAVIKGTVKAVPAPAEEGFSVDLVTAQGKRATRRVEEEIVLPDPAFFTWLNAERKASRLAVLAVTGRVETSMDKLAAGDDDFQKLLDIRRRRLQKPKPTRPAK